MTGAIMDFRYKKQAAQCTLRLDTGSRDALADLCRQRWPSNTAKLAAREWRLTVDQARSVVAGRASQTTIDQIFKAGGWAVVFAVGAKVVGLSADQYLIELRQHHEANAGRLTALTSDLWPVRGAGCDDPPGVAVESRERRVFERRREGQG